MTTPAALEAVSFADVRDKLAAIIDSLPAGVTFTAEHPDVRALVGSGQVPAQWIGQAFSSLAGRRPRIIACVAYEPGSRPASKGHLLRVWEVLA